MEAISPYTVIAVRPIKQYSGPQWLVEPTDEWDDTPHGDNAGPGGIMDADTVHVLDRNIMGWEADAIIRMTVHAACGASPDYPDDCTWDFLARLKES